MHHSAFGKNHESQSRAVKTLPSHTRAYPNPPQHTKIFPTTERSFLITTGQNDKLACDTGRSDQSAQSTQPMPLTIKPPRPPSEQPTGGASQQSSSNDGSSSPVAPAYSPITPKVQPVLPAVGHSQHGFEVPPIPPDNAEPDMSMNDDLLPENSYEHASHSFTGGKAPIPPPAPSAIPETEYIPEPPPQPFSSEDSADAVALRAAISSLQFQKQKAQSDLQTLDALKKQALEDPQRYRRELVAGRLKEERPNFGSIRDVLDAPVEDGEGEDEVVLGAREGHDSPGSKTETQTNAKATEKEPTAKQATGTESPFARIPGPQDIVRMPPVNWDKYHIVGESLDALHEQQRRWPGSTPGQDRGREHSVAAPYSPFYDNLDSQAQHQQQNMRNDSYGSALGTSFGTTTSEHPMETRRTSRN